MGYQFRPKSGSDSRNPMYCPERDLAHVGVSMIRAAAIAQDEQYWESWYREFITDVGLTPERLESGLKRLAEMTETIVTSRDPQVAAAAVAFDKFEPELQVAIYAKLGQVLLAGVWVGVKDLASFNGPTPAPVLDLVAEIESLVTKQSAIRAREARRGWLNRLAVSALRRLLAFVE